MIHKWTSKGLALFCLGSAYCTAFGMGHGEPLGFDHLVQTQQVQYVSLLSVANSQALTEGTKAHPSTFSVGDGLVLRLSPNRLPAAIWEKAVKIRPQQVLSFVETHHRMSSSARALLQNTVVVFEKGNTSIRIVDQEAVSELQKDPFLFLNPFDLKLSHTSISQQKKTLRAIASRSQKRQLTFEEQNFEADTELLRQSILELSGETAPSTQDNPIAERGSTEERKKAQKYLESRFQSLGLATSQQCYRDGLNSGCNILGDLVGPPKAPVIIVSAHLDSVRNKGADDDASGIAALLEIARLYKGKSLPYTIRFIGWDQEELGLIGSKNYVKYLVQKKEIQSIKAVFQMDMIGYDSDNDGKIHVMDCDRPDSTPLTQAVLTEVSKPNSQLQIVSACTNRSDHASFWNADVPATIVSENFFGDDSNVCYHKKCDEVSLINFPYMTRIVSAVANAVWSYSHSQK